MRGSSVRLSVTGVLGGPELRATDPLGPMARGKEAGNAGGEQRVIDRERDGALERRVLHSRHTVKQRGRWHRAPCGVSRRGRSPGRPHTLLVASWKGANHAGHDRLH